MLNEMHFFLYKFCCVPIISSLSVNQICYGSFINKFHVHNFINTLHVVVFTVNSTEISVIKRNVYRYDY